VSIGEIFVVFSPDSTISSRPSDDLLKKM
jgi:hypothetical protein